MKALVLDKPGVLSIKQVEYPVRKDGWAIIRIKAAGVCGSDINAYKGKGQLLGYPLVLGHESAGEVVETSGKSKFKPGDRVMIEPYLSCGTCYACSQGHTNCCEHMQCLGVQTNGAMSEYVSHPESLLHPLPDTVSWAAATVSEPLTIAIHGVHNARVAAGEHVAIIGAGTIGILSGLYVLHKGGIPILIDPIEERLQIGHRLGISHIINPKKIPPEEEILRITNKRGAEVVLEISGSPGGIENTVHLASYCGRISLTGWPSSEPKLDTALITRKELIVYGSRNSAREFPEALNLIAEGKIDVNAIISKTVPFEELPLVIKEVAANPINILKVVGIL
jgi:2-desacetyl-2-hydroxyethyl bacteriochlorophyllide A dehydrogenase